jgi:hypothetical protein
MDKNDARAQISSLIERYKEVAADREKYKTTNEETTKNRFIEHLFEALGWDIENKNQLDTRHLEMIPLLRGNHCGICHRPGL